MLCGLCMTAGSERLDRWVVLGWRADVRAANEVLQGGCRGRTPRSCVSSLRRLAVRPCRRGGSSGGWCIWFGRCEVSSWQCPKRKSPKLTKKGRWNDPNEVTPWLDIGGSFDDYQSWQPAPKSPEPIAKQASSGIQADASALQCTYLFLLSNFSYFLV